MKIFFEYLFNERFQRHELEIRLESEINLINLSNDKKV